MNVAILLFQDFETLDVFGPAEIFGRLVNHYSLKFYSLEGGLVNNHHGISIMTEELSTLHNEVDIFLIPGGKGTRLAVNNSHLIEHIKRISDLSENVITICTGSALLAKTGLLDNKAATSNKRAFDWVITNGGKVNWNKRARWVVDEKFYTSSGVSAGMDMALGFLSDKHGPDFARTVAQDMEYHWNEDKNEDTFIAS